jgi:hypothetical protein
VAIQHCHIKQDDHLSSIYIDLQIQSAIRIAKITIETNTMLNSLLILHALVHCVQFHTLYTLYNAKHSIGGFKYEA